MSTPDDIRRSAEAVVRKLDRDQAVAAEVRRLLAERTSKRPVARALTVELAEDGTLTATDEDGKAVVVTVPVVDIELSEDGRSMTVRRADTGEVVGTSGPRHEEAQPLDDSAARAEVEHHRAMRRERPT